MYKTMLRFGSFFLISLYNLTLKILGLIYKHVQRSKSSLAEEMGSNFSENLSQLDDGVVSDNKSDSVLLQSGLVSNCSKYEVVSGKDLSGFLEEPKTVKFVVQELFVGSDYVGVCNDSEIWVKNDLFEQNLEENGEESDQEPETSPFYFKLLDTSISTIGDTQEGIPERKSFSDSLTYSCVEEVDDEYEEKPDFRVEEMSSMEDECCSYEVELIPSSVVSNQESDANENGGVSIIPRRIENKDSDNWMSSFLDQTKSNEESPCEEVEVEEEELDDEFIELKPQEIPSSSSSWEDSNKSEESLGRKDSDSDDDDEEDVLSEHQNLVQQMKMELKNCRGAGGLPTISEESETPKIVEDLRPLEIDHKIGYKELMEGIHKFYKSYCEKMRKLDILNYQTTHAISFLQLKESHVYTSSKKKADSTTLFFWPTKMRKIYADPIHKPINEMRKDLELVYVGQVCLSWEILSWLDSKSHELLEFESQGSHSYNRAADEFQQFQVLVQRFVEDEQFGGRRDEIYVKNRCVIRGLMQIPTIKDDCVKTKKERSEEAHFVTLEMLVEIIKESMVVFSEFVHADKKATNGGLTKIDLQRGGSSDLMLEVISSLQKKERRMREKIRSENCIVKKLKKHQQRRSESEILAAQVELRLVWRVLNMARLNEDRLDWCKKKLNNISFVGRKVRRESAFSLFPC